MQKSLEKKVHLVDGDTLEVVEKFCYLHQVLCRDGRMHKLVIFRIRAMWNKSKKVSGILC